MLSLVTQIYIITFFFSVVISLFVLLNNYKSYINQYFLLLGLSLALWVLSNIFANLAYNSIFALPFIRIAIVWVALLPIFFNQFVKYLYFYDDKEYRKTNKILLYASCVITLTIILLSQTSLNVKSISFETWGIDYQPGILYLILFCYLLTAFSFSFFHLLKISSKSEGAKGYQARLILIGACITLIFSLFTNVVLPFLGCGLLHSFGPTSVLIFLSFIAYSITRHHLFNIKVIAIELVTFCLWTIIFIRIIMANTQQERLFECGLLIIMIIFGIMLIRSTLHDVKQREYIDKLSRDLKDTYELLKRRE